MTTLVGFRGINFVIIGADSRVTEGNIKIPFPYQKITPVGESNLVAGAGGVGNLQRILQIAIRNIRISKASEDFSNVNPSYSDIVKQLADLNFSIPLEHKHYSPFGFLVAGVDNKNIPSLSAVGDDGSILNIPSFYAEGSGSNFAFSILQKEYYEKINLKEALLLGHASLLSASELDSFTDDNIQLFALLINANHEPEVHQFSSLKEINSLELEGEKK